MNRLLLLSCVLAVGLSAADPAFGSWDFLPGTICKPANEAYLSGGHVYRKASFVNPESSNRWDVQIAVCPVGWSRGDGATRSMAIGLSGDRALSSWCRLYSALGDEVVFAFARPNVDGQATVAFEVPPTEPEDLRLGFTLQCLLLPGTSLDLIGVFSEDD
ncbi:MAG: hypothetical protein AAGA81_13565 [Acidobacteriota bacterium]